MRDHREAAPDTPATPHGTDFDTFFAATYPGLVRALTLAAGPEAAVEATHDAFVQAARHWRRVSTYDRPDRWVRRVALGRLANQRRSWARRQAALARLVPQPPAEQTPADLDLAAAVAALPHRQRLAVALHYLADLPVDEVAALLEVSPGTVKSNLHDARRALRARLEVNDDAR